MGFLGFCVRETNQELEINPGEVEMAIISPLLFLLFIGVLEVGWAIRGYIVLLNADREATRFAARVTFRYASNASSATRAFRFRPLRRVGSTPNHNFR